MTFRADFCVALLLTCRTLCAAGQATGPGPAPADTLTDPVTERSRLDRQTLEIDRLRLDGKPGEALALATDLLARQIRAHGKESLEVARIVLAVARLHRDRGDRTMAGRFSTRATEILRKLPPEIGGRDLEELLLDRARTLAHERDAPGSVAAAREALSLVEKRTGAGSVDSLRTLERCAALRVQLGQHLDAESLLTRVVAAHEKLSGKDGLPVARAMALLAAAQRGLGRSKDSLLSARRALEICERSPDRGGHELAEVLREVRSTLFQLGDSDGMVRAARLDYTLSSADRPGDDEDRARRLRHLAHTLKLAQRYDEALAKLGEALQVYEAVAKTLPGIQAGGVGTLEDLAMNLLDLGDAAAGRRAQQLASVSFAAAHKVGKVTALARLRELSTVAILQESRDGSGARRLAEETLAALDLAPNAELGQAIGEVAATGDRLLLFWNDRPASRLVNERRLAVRQSLPGQAAMLLARDRVALARTLPGSERQRQDRLIQEARSACQREPDTHDEPLLEALQELAWAFVERGDGRSAAAVLDRALISSKKAAPSRQPGQHHLGTLADLHRRAGDPVGEMSVLEYRLALARQAPAPRHEELVESMAALCGPLRRLGRDRDALEMARRALATEESAGSCSAAEPHHLMALAQQLRAVGEKDRARKVHEKALAILEPEKGGWRTLHARHEAALALLLLEQNDRERARALATDALSQRRAETAARQTAWDWGEEDLAVVHAALGDLATARELCEAAVAREGRHAGVPPLELAATLESLARAERSAGARPLAEAHEKRALAVREANRTRVR